MQAVVVVMAAAACGAPLESETAEEGSTEIVEDQQQDETTESESVDRPNQSFDWQGHRGARGLRPENTLPGFELALDLGVDTLELDLHLSADDQVVVWHDPVIDEKKCGTAAAGVRVRDLSADELRQLDCRLNPDQSRFPDQKPDPGELAGDDYGIVTLSALFEFVADYEQSETKTDEQQASASSVRFNIETKRKPDDPAAIGDGFDGTNAGRLELAVGDAVIIAGLLDRVTVQSFDHRSLVALAARYPEMSLAALTRRDDNIDAETLANLADQGAEVWSPDYRSLTAETVEAAKGFGLMVIPWTVNDPSEMNELIELGVDGIITDRPDLRPSNP